MKRFPVLFLSATLFVLAACGETRTEIIREVAGCTSDAMCADHDEMTTETCEVDSGICVRSRLVPVVCESFLDCDDGDASSVDTCNARGICDHATNTIADFDPASPERQDVRALCEQPLSCDLGEAPYITMSYNSCDGVRHAWNERGYMIWADLIRPTSGLTRLHVLPQMRAGDPTDLFRVSTYGEDIREAPVSVRDMTGRELETEGVMINIAPPATGEWYNANVFVFIDFADPNAYRSRALQWALPPGAVTDADTGRNFSPCLQVGPYMNVPQHGLLHLGEDSSTHEPTCTGIVRGPDAWTAGSVYPGGLFRTVSDARLRYINELDGTPRVFQFNSLKEFTDWFNYNGASDWHPVTFCDKAAVFEDAALTRALADHEVFTVGARPGTPVTWFDSASGVHYGFADRGWVIRDIGNLPTFPSGGLYCTNYEGYRADSGCWLDLAGISRYSTVITDPTTVDPIAMNTASGWIYGYND